MAVRKIINMKGLAVLIIMVTIFGLPLGGLAADYSDIDGHYAESHIKSWLQQGLAGGYPDGTFRPGNPVSRAEFANFIKRAYTIPDAPAGAKFSDLPADTWFFSGVASVINAGLMGGYPDGSFRPGNSITRQEAAVVLNKLLGLKEEKGFSGFTDKEDIAKWAADAVQAVSAAGLMGGYPDETFRPQNAINRAEAIVILDLGLDYKETKKVAETVFDKPGIFGPEEGVQTITGNVTVKADGVTLRNVVIAGNLLLHEAIGNGDVTLKNVRVSGETKVEGGGAHSVTLEDCTLPSITVSKEGVRVVASGNTTVTTTTLESGAVLVSATTTGAGFEAVTVSQVVPPGAKISLAGQFEQVIVASAGVEVEVKEGNINTITIESEAKITGQGTITTANIKVSGVEIAQNPTNTNVDSGISASVGGQTVTSTSQGSTIQDSDGGGGDDTPSIISVSAISVSPATMTLAAGGATGTISVVITPDNATNKTVSWSSSNSNVATVVNGIVTPVMEGTATITATSVADGTKYATCAVTVVSSGDFIPGEGGSLPAFTPFTPDAGKIGGLYVTENQRVKDLFFGSIKSNIDMKFLPPSNFGATGYTLQYSDDDGSSWSNYSDVSTSNDGQDNFSLTNIGGNYQYRLLVNGGPCDGYTSNVVEADLSTVDARFTGWSLDESVHISPEGIMVPFVGRGLEASFTVTRYVYDDSTEVYTDENMTYQWYRVNPASYEMSAINGATNLTHITTEEDVGYHLLIRATGDNINVGGFMQILASGGIVIPNKAFISNITDSGFTLNLHKAINNLEIEDLILDDYNGDEVVITSVTKGPNDAIYHIEANINATVSPFWLRNNSRFWRIVSEVAGGHMMMEGIEISPQ